MVPPFELKGTDKKINQFVEFPLASPKHNKRPLFMLMHNKTYKEVMMKEKKGLNLQTAVPAVLMVVLIAVLVIVGIYMFSNIQTGLPDISNSITNESGALNDTGMYLINRTDCGFSSPVITLVTNATSGATVSSSNYAVSSTGVLINTTAAGGAFNTVKVSYTYNNKGAACTGSDSMIAQFSNYPALVGLIGTIVLLAIVIGIIIVSFAFGRNRA